MSKYALIESILLVVKMSRPSPGFSRRAAGNENPSDTKGKDQVYSPLFVKACPSCNYLKVHTHSCLHTDCAKTRTTL